MAYLTFTVQRIFLDGTLRGNYFGGFKIIGPGSLTGAFFISVL